MSKNSQKSPPHLSISVVIPVLNEEKFIGKTLYSLLNQDFNDFEIIVVDNGSIDKTAQIAKKFGAIVLTEEKKGVAFARQKGFLNARAEIIASTDGDTVLPRNWIRRIWAEFQKDEDLIAFGGSCIFYSGPFSVKLAARYFLPLFLLLDKIFSGGWNLMGSNFSVRKGAFLEIGGFKTNLKLNEDIEISHRLRKIGKVILDPNFKIKISGRRYRHGLIFGLMYYAPSTIFRFLFKKYDKFQKLTQIRTEEPSLLYKLSFSIFVFSIFLFYLFYFHPQIAQAKKLEWIRRNINKAVLIKNKIENKIKMVDMKIK